ncbi:MAG: Abi family protein [Oscillospiraceae bacterium]|jgi:abortive infection bacteriophage resistance protein|nr:Abi family protein [Oscillospiraceae bacterium]
MVKSATTYDAQIAKIRAHGCIVEDETACREILANVNYYRLSAYFLPFMTIEKQYKTGTEFATVYKTYEFDRKMRQVLFSAMEEVEVFLRAQLSYFHGHKYGSLGYLDTSNFNNRHNHDRFLKELDREIDRNRTVLFVNHHINKYNRAFPIWVAVELFSFGALSRFYIDLPLSDQKALARDLFHTVPKNVASWLRCCTDLRNLCAHYGRLYYRIFGAIPAGLSGIDLYAERRLFATVLALRALFPDAAKWNAQFLHALTSLLDAYEGAIDLAHIGFPEDWETKLRK